MDSDRLAGTLMCAGATLGLIGTGLGFFFFPFSILGWTSFGLVLLFGVSVFRKRREGDAFAAASLWFAPLGGIPNLWFFGFFSSDRLVLATFLSLLGMAAALTGAAAKLTKTPTGPAWPPQLAPFRRAAGLLGTGSSLLLVAAATGYPSLSPRGYGELIGRTILVLVGVWFHLFAWIALMVGTGSGFGAGDTARRLNWGRFALVLSVISFVVAVVPAMQLLPFGPEPFTAVLWLPYHPAVFAPVVLCHAFIFLLYSRFVAETGPRKAILVGIIALTVSAILGLGGLVAYYAQLDAPLVVYWWVFLPFPSGATAIGYWLVFYGWQRGIHLRQKADALAST